MIYAASDRLNVRFRANPAHSDVREICIFVRIGRIEIFDAGREIFQQCIFETGGVPYMAANVDPSPANVLAGGEIMLE
jgi:hypothetical protein